MTTALAPPGSDVVEMVASAKSLGKEELAQRTVALANHNAVLQQRVDSAAVFIGDHLPTKIGMGARTVISEAASAITGGAFGSLSRAWALVGAAAGAATTGVLAVVADKAPNLSEALLTTSLAIANSATAIEAKSAAEDFWAARKAKKAAKAAKADQ